MLYISKSDFLVVATYVMNDDNEWHLHSSSEEKYLEKPLNFVLNGDDNQELLFSYFETSNGVGIYGFKYTDTKPLLVNGNPIETKTYSFTLNEKRYSIDYWWMDDIDTNNEEVDLSYQTQKTHDYGSVVLS